MSQAKRFMRGIRKYFEPARSFGWYIPANRRQIVSALNSSKTKVSEIRRGQRFWVFGDGSQMSCYSGEYYVHDVTSKPNSINI